MAVDGVGLPFQEAIDYFRRKVNLPTARWDDLKHDAHVRAFSVAGVTRDDMLTDFRIAMEKAISQGTGFEEFRRDFDAIVDRTGWVFNSRGKTDEQRRAWRARIIYNTNMRTSYMAGRYQQMTDPAVLEYRPNWLYVHNDSRHPRPYHVRLGGKVFAANDPIWNVIFPPNGWGCKCDVQALSDRQLQKLGKSGPDAKPDWLQPYQATDPRTGQPEERYPGIDRGWEYNVGKTARDGIVPVELQEPLPSFREFGPPKDPGNKPPLPEPRKVDESRLLPEDRTAEFYADAFLGEFGATRDKPQIWRDPSGGVVTIDGSLFEKRAKDQTVTGLKADKRGRGPYMLLLADTVKDPDEIWVDWAMVRSGPVLKRAYLRQVLLPDGKQLMVRYEWSSAGWIGITAFQADEPNYLDGLRAGALLYRRR